MMRGSNHAPNRVGHQAASGEHLHELGPVAGDHQVAGQGQMRTHAGRGAVDRRDHGHVAVEQRGEQRVLAVEHHPAGVAHDPLGHVGRAVGVAVGVAKVGAGAEEPVARAGDHRAPGPMAGVETVED